MKILIVEDDKSNREFLVSGFSEQGYVVDSAEDGHQGLMLATEEQYQLIILDRMLPKLDGLAILAALRVSDNATPVLILSALGEVDDRIKGLRSGGDDYMVKPFSFAELLIRSELLLKRGSSAPQATTIELGNLKMDLLAHRVLVGEHPIELQAKEFRLLRFFMEHSGQMVTRTLLFESVWDQHFDPGTNVIDVHIARLRKKLDAAKATLQITTVRGAGYRLEPTS
ncbi:response regulator transcription factor [Ferrimonas kyonanensis]|uniref:response regulator transcription factor n=1 Tax=Ferrimonas kyonanensis TaxID=364763 RepID=UPI0003FBE17F|nr:response regulator transcription factor [Ferrimonas kyonanensis]